MGPSHIFIWGSAADHNMMLCWPLSYVRALYVVNTFLCFCSIAAGTSSNIFANMVRTFRQVVVVVQLCEDDWCAWWPPGGSASSQSWGERGGCWGDLVQVIRIINILPHPCLRESCSEGSLEDGSQCADFQMLVAMHRQWHLWQRDREGHTGRCCQSAEVDPAQCALSWLILSLYMSRTLYWGHNNRVFDQNRKPLKVKAGGRISYADLCCLGREIECKAISAKQCSVSWDVS